MSWENVCPVCRAMLDPGEQCDCKSEKPPEENFSDSLTHTNINTSPLYQEENDVSTENSNAVQEEGILCTGCGKEIKKGDFVILGSFRGKNNVDFEYHLHNKDECFELFIQDVFNHTITEEGIAEEIEEVCDIAGWEIKEKEKK